MSSSCVLNNPGQSEARGDAANFDALGDDAGDDFLSRERALLGDDADQFASEGDKLATVEDGDDDLLGGDFGGQTSADSQEVSGFESSFPAIDTSNEVSMGCVPRLDAPGV